MKLIITIPKDKYCYIQELKQSNTDYATTRMLYHAIKHGKPYIEERKTGKWIRQGGIHNMYTSYACSECGRAIDMYYDFGNIPTDADVINEFPYCHCGAKMEVDEC